MGLISTSRLMRTVAKPFIQLLRRVSILSSRNPTKDWKKDSTRELVIDLEKATLCGIALGEPVESLKFLGPCESFDYGSMDVMCVNSDGEELTDETDIDSGPVFHHTLGYDSMGIAVFSEPNLNFEFFTVTFVPDDTEPLTTPYAGFFQFAESIFAASEICDAFGVIKTLGEPSHDINFEELGWTMSKLNPFGPPWHRELRYEHKSSLCSIFLNQDNRTTSLILMPNPQDESRKSRQVSREV